MNPKETETVSSLQIRMDDLATGQLGPLAAWRLRRRIARDPALAREFTEIQRMQTDLRSLARQNRIQFVQPFAGKPNLPATCTTGRLVIKQRSVLAACLLTIFAITGGAIASHYWTKPPSDAGCTMLGWSIDSWHVRGYFRGKATIISPRGNFVNVFQLDGTSPDASLRVVYSTVKHGKLAQVNLQGIGKHPIRDRSGKLLGTVILSPLTDRDVQQIANENDEVIRSFQDFYQRPERVTPSDDKRGYGNVVAAPGLVGGVFDEDVRIHGATYSVTQGASWKVYGEARVKAQLLTKSSMIVMTERGVQLRIPLKAKSIVEAGVTQPIPSLASLDQMSPEQEKLFKSVTFRGQPIPIIYWALAEARNDWIYRIKSTGEWERVLRSGKFTGYGRHEVKDENGKTVLVLMVSPLTPTKPAR